MVVCLVDRNCGKGREILDSGKKLGYFGCFNIISYAMIVNGCLFGKLSSHFTYFIFDDVGLGVEFWNLFYWYKY